VLLQVVVAIIALFVYIYFKKNVIQMYQNSVFLNDNKIIRGHFEKEFSLFTYYGEALLIIPIIMKVTTGTSLVAVFGLTCTLLSLPLIYIQ